MIQIAHLEPDDESFIGLIIAAVNNLTRSLCPTEVYAIKIDHWFDFKWRNFQGKLLGAVGSWNDKQLRIPPFIPDRVVSQDYFVNIDGAYENRDISGLHIYQTSQNNITGKRRLVSTSGTRMFVWFSGDTKRTGRGSLMVYEVSEGSHKTFYISFLKKTIWQVNETDGVSRNEALSLLEPGQLVS